MASYSPSLSLLYPDLNLQDLLDNNKIIDLLSGFYTAVSGGLAIDPHTCASFARVVGLYEALTAKTSAYCCSCRGQQLDILSRQGSAGSVIDMTIGLWLDTVCQEGDWDGTRPWPCP